jgi:outer membrane protein OmpA-like peptidoglycan-associated protein
MSHQKNHAQIRLEAKRHTELWIYSFADMYMILSVFFIAISVIYAAKAKHSVVNSTIPTAGRGPAAVTSLLSIEFGLGTDELSEMAQKNLKLVLPALRESKGAIEIEGYADGKSMPRKKSKFSSNLALSNARAVRVAEWLIDQGVSARRVRTSAYGDSRLFQTGPHGIATNRRVVLKVLPVEGG